MDRFKLPSEISDDQWPAPEDFVEEAKACVRAAADQGLTLRVMGGLAIFLHSQERRALWEKLGRLGRKVFTDIDYVSYGKHRVKMIKFFENRGFVINQKMLYHYGKTRQIYYGEKIPMAEVFYDQMQFNHPISFKNRLERDSPTFPLAELLLQKLQMVKMNEKDIKDVLILLLAHETGDDDENRINRRRLADVLCTDWGFYHTATENLGKVRSSLAAYPAIELQERNIIGGRISEVLEYLEQHPKSLKWKSRAVIGTKMRWYNEVDEWDVIDSQGQ
ncbi:MAG: hypothetical protein JSV89_16975 [Spirochaetaceae bacterium]|nr:MAG: hypothetical protein JSV89_16975 [Spirochaetaceae bacterium]